MFGFDGSINQCVTLGQRTNMFTGKIKKNKKEREEISTRLDLRVYTNCGFYIQK